MIQVIDSAWMRPVKSKREKGVRYPDSKTAFGLVLYGMDMFDEDDIVRQDDNPNGAGYHIVGRTLRRKGNMAKLYYCTCVKPDFVENDGEYICFKCSLPPVSTVMPEPAAQQGVHLTGLTQRQIEEVEQIVMRVLLAYLAKSPRK